MNDKKASRKKLIIPVGEGTEEGEGTMADSEKDRAVLPPIKHEDIEISFEDTGSVPQSMVDRALQLEPPAPPEGEPAATPKPAQPPPPVPRLEDFAEYQALAQENQKLAHEKMVLADQIRRKMADFENYKKRMERERVEFQSYSNSLLVTDLLPFLDNLERALTHTNHESNKAFVDGVELIYRQVREMLNRYGVRSLETVGTPFDPNFHQAIGFVETSEVPDGHVAEQLMTGYMMHDRLLRPASVRVARAPAGVPEAAAEAMPVAEKE
ncbi:MAG: nucleotide exchange factor GrpE [Acidobacteria bacterium]|nr:nucleotide exchange factor GrpE [Acidobacteriota bacterium]